MTSPIDVVLARLDGVARTGKSFKARCPAHVDKTPSLSVKEGEGGRVLLHCFSGCEFHEVVAALGLKTADLFARGSKKQYEDRIPGVSLRELAAATEFERQVLFFVDADKQAGKEVSLSDLERAKLALMRIALARRIL